MDLLQRFLDQFTPSGEAEALWLKDIFTFITEHLQPELSGPAPPAADDVITGVCSDQLSVCVVKKIKENMSVTHTLPVSYRPVSVSELLSRQHLSCVSNLSWSTNQQRAWAKEAELSLPGQRALPRVNLLLIGCLREGRGGEWRLTDASGSVRCECLSPSPLWLNHPVFLPHWNYIPHNAPGQDQDQAGGYLELIGSPVVLCPGPELRLAAGPGGGAGLSRAGGVREAAGLLQNSLVPSVMKQQCVCVLSWKMMECVRKGGGRRRDIYSEMLDEPHTCPLTQYHADPAVHQYISVSELSQSLQSDCWSSLSLSSLLPSGGSSLTRSQINTALAWSCRTLTSDPQNNPQSGDRLRQRPLLLVGVLELPSQTSEPALQLRDGTGAVACVVTETREEEGGGQRAAFNTAWIGCLVCVRQFTMVTERFIQSDFPSYQHLDQDKYITHKHCRVYLQFSLDHVHILSPSVAMVTHLRLKGEESGGDVTGRKQTAEEEMEGGQTAGRKRRREEPDSSHSASSSVTMTTDPGSDSQPSVSMVIRVEQKEGVAWRNTGAGLKEEEAGLTLCFSVRAAVIGPVVSWGRDPKNRPMTERETEKEDKVVLVFSGVSARWFPLLQPGSFYRLIAANTQDPSVLIGCGVSGRSGVEFHTDSTLQVRPDWRFHTLTRPLLLHTYRQALSPSVLSVSELLDCRSELVCFQALVSDRISLNDRTRDSGDTHTGVRLTVCDQTGRSLQVYLDLSHTPYPPGLLPGNTLLLSAFQIRLSRTESVYCSYLPVSSITVVSLGDTSAVRPPPPIMHLGVWATSTEQRCILGQVKGHVVCFLFLLLQWICSLCGSLYVQCCSSSQCRSTSSVFQSKAKLVIDDGTGEAHVWFSGALVRPLLGLADSQWEGLQRALKVRGHIKVYPRGRSLVCDSDDSLLHFLLCVCSSDVVCRQLSLTCRKHNNQRSEEKKRFSRGERDFMTRMTRPLQLTCLHINTH